VRFRFRACSRRGTSEGTVEVIDAIVCNLMHIQLLDPIEYKSFFEGLIVLERVGTASTWLSKETDVKYGSSPRGTEFSVAIYGGWGTDIGG